MLPREGMGLQRWEGVVGCWKYREDMVVSFSNLAIKVDEGEGMDEEREVRGSCLVSTEVLGLYIEVHKAIQILIGFFIYGERGGQWNGLE